MRTAAGARGPTSVTCISRSWAQSTRRPLWRIAAARIEGRKPSRRLRVAGHRSSGQMERYALFLPRQAHAWSFDPQLIDRDHERADYPITPGQSK